MLKLLPGNEDEQQLGQHFLELGDLGCGESRGGLDVSQVAVYFGDALVVEFVMVPDDVGHEVGVRADGLVEQPDEV